MFLFSTQKFLGIVTQTVLVSLLIWSYAVSTPMVQAAPALSLSNTYTADSWVDSIGLNTHLDYTDTVYWSQYDSIVRPRLQELGVRHLRQSIPDCECGDSWNWKKLPWRARVQELSKLGINFTITGAGFGKSSGSILQQVKIIDPMAGFVAAVEGQNEYDIFNGGVPRQEWVASIKQQAQQMHTVFKNDPVTANKPLLAPSWAFLDQGVEDNYMTPFVDFNNAHPYYDPKPLDSDQYLIENLALHSRVAPGKPTIVTEFGYSTGIHDRAVTESVQSKYMLRSWLNHFNQGVKRSFGYELLDLRQDPKNRDNNFGLLRADGSPKPAFRTLQNTIQILQERGASFNQPQPLELALTLAPGSPVKPENLQHTVLQKSNGEYYLIVWLGIPSNDNDISATAKLDLGFSSNLVEVYQPSVSPRAQVRLGAGNSFALTVSDNPTILKISPQVQAGTATKLAPDLLWRNNQTGEPVAWYLDLKGNYVSSRSFTNPGPSWKIKYAKDLNRDGVQDIIFQNDNGQPALWLMYASGNIYTGNGFANQGNPGTSWEIVGAGDFNKDGNGDILFQNLVTGEPVVWYLDAGSNFIGSKSLSVVNLTGWKIVTVVDLNRDGVSDLIFRNTASGQPALWIMDRDGRVAIGNGFDYPGNPGPAWNIVGMGDFNADSNGDIVWQNSTTGEIGLWYLDSKGNFIDYKFLINPGPAWRIKYAKDINRDGISDIVFQNDNGQPALWLMTKEGTISSGNDFTNPGNPSKIWDNIPSLD